jgi:protein-S-isoprenylcysteine O-methyltransferase Ste14
MTGELVARFVVGAAAGGLLVTGLTVLALELKSKRPDPVERDKGPLASINFVGILGFVGVGLGTAIWSVGIIPLHPGWIDTTVRVSGVVILGLAGILAGWGLRSIGHQMSSQAEVRPDTELVTDGAFRLIRHPLYLSILLLWTGGTLALASWLMAMCTTALVPLFIARSRLEERMLLRHFGDAYAAYMARVPMLLPGQPGPSPRTARDQGLHPLQ